MRMHYEPDESDEFSAAADLLIRRGLAWADEQDLPADGFIWSAALDLRHGSADGRLGYWTGGEVRRLLLDFIPREVTALPERIADAPAWLSTLLSYLDATGLLDPRGDDLAALRQATTTAAIAYPEAIADPNRWGLAKFWSMTALEAGVDPSDEAGMADFIEEVTNGRIPLDEEVIAAIMVSRETEAPLTWERAFSQPPIDLPSLDVLAKQAAENRLVTSLVALTDWIGPNGRDLTGEGALHLDEAREAARLLDTGEADFDVSSGTGLPRLGLLIEWAKRTGIIRQYRGRLVRVKKNAGRLRDPLALWRRAVDAFGEIGYAVCVSPWPGEVFDQFAEGFAEYIPDILNSVYGLPVATPVPRLLEPILLGLTEVWWVGSEDRDALQRELRTDIDQGLGHALDALVEYGVLTSERGKADPMFLADLSGELSEDGEPTFPTSTTRRLRRDLARPQRLVKLTSLGAWAVRERMSDEGRNVPLVGELAGVSPVQLLGVLVDDGYPPAHAFTEIDRWLAVDGHTTDDLIAAIGSCPFRARRVTLLSVLVDSMPDGDSLLHRLRSDRQLAPLAIQLLTDRDELSPDDLSPEESVRMLVESLATLVEMGGPDALREVLASIPEADLSDLVEQMTNSPFLDATSRGEFAAAAAEVTAS